MLKAKPVKLAPSILTADFGHLADEIRAAEEGGADYIHLDIMDGTFVPNITFGPLVVETVRRLTKLPLDVHLMIHDPERYVADFAKAGANNLTVQVEACRHLHSTVQKINERTTKLLGSLVSTSNEITLALWDDAVEDGDTISLNVNGNWIAKDFPVLKRPQFIKVTIKPGANSIVFVANNLGSIPPNTAVLEIIDGKKRKSFMIDTDLEKNNLVRIFYDFKPGD